MNDPIYETERRHKYCASLDAFNRQKAEIERLRAALSPSRCPYPIGDAKTVGACVVAGKCGCDNRAALSVNETGDPKCCQSTVRATT